MGTKNSFTANWQVIRTAADLPPCGEDGCSAEVLLSCDSDDGAYVDTGYREGPDWVIGFARQRWDAGVVRAWMPKPAPWTLGKRKKTAGEGLG